MTLEIGPDPVNKSEDQTPPKKKYKYTKKTGKPPKKIEDILPADWRDQLLELSAQGCSDVEIRAKLCLPNGKFSANIWYALKERDAQFKETLQIGKVLCQAWWEEQGRTSVKSANFQTGLWYANMKNRFGWRDIKEQTEDDLPEKLPFSVRLFNGKNGHAVNSRN